MIRSEAVARIQTRLSFRTDREAEIIDALKDTQVELEREHELPWFLLSEVASYSTTANEERVSHPSDYLREWEGDHIWLFIAGDTVAENIWTPLLKVELDQLRLDYAGSGPPEAYAVSGNYWRLGPVPDDTYTLKQIYYKQDDTLDTNIENAWLKYAPDLMIGKAGRKIAWPLRDMTALAEFEKMEFQGNNRMLIENIQHEQVNRDLQMGGPD